MKKDFRTKNLLSQFALNPKFTEVCDCIVLADTSVELLPQKLLQTREDRQRTEYLLNRREVWELFEVPPPEPSPKLLCEAGNMLREVWESKLKSEFPDREFVVYFEYAPPVCDISFFQALDWHIEAAAQAKGNRKSRRVDWRPRLVRNPLLSPKKRE
jgi:hypothetical protein